MNLESQAFGNVFGAAELISYKFNANEDMTIHKNAPEYRSISNKYYNSHLCICVLLTEQLFQNYILHYFPGKNYPDSKFSRNITLLK